MFFPISFLSRGRSEYNRPMDFKLIPVGESKEVSLKKTFQFSNESPLSNVKKDFDKTVKFVFI